MVVFVFFKQKTAYEMRISDWSSDVCSSDLRLAKTAAVPCIVKPADGDISAEEDSYAENTYREPLHPLDQFRAMQVMVDERQDIEAIAAHFMTTPADVRQRLKLESVSPKLHEIYAEDGMTLERSEEQTSELKTLMR